MSAVDVLHTLDSIARDYDVLLPKQAGEVLAARAEVAELVECYDAMLSRWWSNRTDADKALGNRAAAARMRFNGESYPTEPPIDETLGERRREAAERSRGETP